MLIESSRPSNDDHPSLSKIQLQDRQFEQELNFQSFSSNNQLFQDTSNKVIIIRIISISLLLVIIALIQMMGKAVLQNNDLISKMIDKHIDNNGLQDEFESKIINITYALKQISIMSIQQNLQQEYQFNQLKGILKKYQIKINQIENFLKRPEIQIERDLNNQALNLIELSKSRIFLKQLAYTNDYNNYSIKTVNKEHKLSIPKNIWVFKENPFNYIRKLINENRIYYANISGYNLHFVNYDNMRTYLPKKIQNNIRKGVQLLSKRLSGELLHFATKKLILLGFLQTHGGIMIDGLYSFTEDLSWIDDIININSVSRGNRYIQPKIITFYNPLQSSQKKKFNIIPFEGMEENDRFILEYPKIEQYFMAAYKGTQFLQDLIAKINQLINDIDSFWKYNSKYSLKYDRIEDFTKNIIFVASRIILLQKQKIIDENNKGNNKIFALDYYGINCINSNYGPSKSSIIFQHNIQSIPNVQSYYHMLYHDLAHYSQRQLASYFGKFKYLSNFNFEYFLNMFIEKTSKDKDIQIYEGSFIQQIFYPQKKHAFIVNNPEKIFINSTNQQWDSLNTIVWILQTNSQKSQWSKICMKRIYEIASNSNFQVRRVNEDNIQLYLQKQIIYKIRNTIMKSPLQNIPNLKENLYKLSILYEYGGIILNQSTLSLQNLDWLLNIGKYPSQYIFNRFDSLPKVFMMFNPFTRSQQKWDIRSIAKDKSVKTQWHQQLLSDVLIAQEGSQFIGEWLDALFQILKFKTYQIEELFRKNKVGQHKASDWNNHNIFFTDTAKFILGRKQMLLQTQANNNYINSAHYYKLWTINAYLTPFKLRNNFNYQALNQPISSYIYRFPLQNVRQIIGQIHFMSTAIDKNQYLIDDLLIQSDNNEINSKSLIKVIRTKDQSQVLKQQLFE